GGPERRLRGEGGDAFLVEGPVARGRQARHHGELHPARPHHQRADPAQLLAGIPQEGERGGHPGGRVRPARGPRQPGGLPFIAARALHHRRRHSRRWRAEEIPVLRTIFFALLLASFSCWGQSYPAKPIRLVVPFAPGGSSSLVARFMGEEMAKDLGQSFVIENKPGGGGNIAMQEVARADPDGYTLIIGHVGSLAMNPYMYSRLPYDVDKDFAAVSLLAIVPNIFVVYHEVPAKDLREFVALAKSKPGQINYGSAGNGSAGHLAMEYLKQVAGIELQHVPYKGTGPNITDLVAGRTQATSAGTPPLLPHVKSGKLRVIAVGTAK